jgi:hypothetical protein
LKKRGGEKCSKKRGRKKRNRFGNIKKILELFLTVREGLTGPHQAPLQECSVKTV